VYTPETATEELKKISPLLLKLKQKHNRYTKLVQSLAQNKSDNVSNEELEILEYEIVEIMKSLEEKRIYIRQINPLIVDFLAIRMGQPVYLCWKENEPKVSHYHGTAEGFSGRRIVTPFDEWQVFLVKN